MLKTARKIFRKNAVFGRSSLRFERPIVVLQSDDWGRVGIRDLEGRAALQDSGLTFGNDPYDSYSLETSADVQALAEMLLSHTDSCGRNPRMVMNFVMANLDFNRMASEHYEILRRMPLSQGLPGRWSRPGLFEAYRSGIASSVFYPALHGLTHFCWKAVDRALQKKGKRAKTLKTFWKTETPYIFWRMPWVGFEYQDSDSRPAKALSLAEQFGVIEAASEVFHELFDRAPFSACAPGYRFNNDTKMVWSKIGIQVVQHGTPSRPPAIDDRGILQLSRSFDFEPALHPPDLKQALACAAREFELGRPFVLSVHSVNFHSTIKDFRSGTIKALNSLLKSLRARHPDLLFMNDHELYRSAVTGKIDTPDGNVSVKVKTVEPEAEPVAGR